ncbi:MAG: hypothetical protein ACFB10_00505 [Salibacteraceae bacterium]
MSRNPRKSKAKKPKRKGLNIVLYILGLLVFQELIFRWLFPLPDLANFNRVEFQATGNMQPTSANYVRKVDMHWRSTPDTNATFHYLMNAYGFRDKDWDLEKSSGTDRIMFIGDSFVEGMMVEEEKNIPSTFEALATADGRSVETMNLGMMGVGVPHYKSLMYNALPKFNPDEVILVLYANDVAIDNETGIRGIKFTSYSSTRPRLLELFDMAGRKEPLPFRWHIREDSFYKPVPSPQNPWTTNEQEYRQYVTPQIAEAMIAADFNYFRINWVQQEQNYLRAKVDLGKDLGIFKKLADQNNTPLRIVYIPSRHQVTNYYYQFERKCCLTCPGMIDMTGPEYQVHAAMLAQRCQQLGLPFLDLTPLVKSAEDTENHLYWDYDDHMRGKGYQMMAREIYRWAVEK